MFFTVTEHRGTEAPRQNRNAFLGVSVSRWYVAVNFSGNTVFAAKVAANAAARPLSIT